MHFIMMSYITSGYFETKKHCNNKDNSLENHKSYKNINMNNIINKDINKNRRRNIIWFNPPPLFANSDREIGKYFLGLINK